MNHMSTIKCVIWQDNACSELYRKIIDQMYSPVLEKLTGSRIETVAYLSAERKEEKNGFPVIGAEELGRGYVTGEYQIIVIPIQNHIDHSSLTSVFALCGIRMEDVYLAPRLSDDVLSEQKLSSLLTPYESAKYLPYLEFHVADQCNLNCKACEHYSGLVEEEVFPDFEKFRRDLNQLHRFIEDIGVIRVLGGEPLLNPELPAYLELVRQVYPQTLLRIVTNGLLLFSAEDAFFDAVRGSDTEICISYYPPLQKRKNELEALLAEKQVRFVFSLLINEFTKKQVLEAHENPVRSFLQCNQAHCNNLYDGKVAACFLPFTTKYFNRYFGKSLPEDGAVDLYEEDMTTERLKRALNTPLQRCAYCTSPVPIAWDVIGTPSALSDWVIS